MKKRSPANHFVVGLFALLLVSARAATPILLGHWPDQARSGTNAPFANDVDVQGHFAFLADGSGGMQILDVSNPATPALIGNYPTTAGAKAVSVNETNALVVASVLHIVDVSNPASPNLRGTYEKTNIFTHYSSALNDAAWWNGYALVSYANYGVILLDISNMETVREVRTLPGPYSLGVSSIGFDRIETTASLIAYTIKPDYHNGTALTIVDMRDSALRTWGAWGVPNFVTGASFADGFAFVWTAHMGLQSLDIHNLQAIQPVGSIPNLGRPESSSPGVVGIDGFISRSGDIAVIGTGSAIYIVDVSSPSNPTQLAQFQTRGSPTRVIARGTIAYVAEGLGGLEIIDFGPVIRPTIRASSAARQISIQIGGKQGTRHALETSASVGPGAVWSRMPSFVLDQNNQSVTLSPSTTTFYRVVETPTGEQ